MSKRTIAWRAVEERELGARAVCSLRLDGESPAVIDVGGATEDR